MKQHYADLSAKKFFAGLCKYMSSGPVVAMVGDKYIIIMIKLVRRILLDE